MVCRTLARQGCDPASPGRGRLRAARSAGECSKGAKSAGQVECQARLARSVSSATLRSGTEASSGAPAVPARTFIGAGCGKRSASGRRRPPVCKAGAQRGYVCKPRPSGAAGRRWAGLCTYPCGVLACAQADQAGRSIAARWARGLGRGPGTPQQRPPHPPSRPLRTPPLALPRVSCLAGRAAVAARR